MNFKSESKALMNSLGEGDDPSDTDELKIIRVNDIDLKQAVDGLEDSEDEDLEDEKDYNKKKSTKKTKKNKNKMQIMAENQHAEEPAEENNEEDAAPPKKEKSQKLSEKKKEEKADDDDDESAANSSSNSNNTDADSNSTESNMNRYGRYKRAPGREEGDYGFDEPEAIENDPKYRKEMDRVLGKTK